MPKLQSQPLHVAARVNRLVVSKLQPSPPAWLGALTAFPPTRTLDRPVKRVPNKKQKKCKTLFMPPQIVYEEDKLRQEFFGDHPWELARPRMMHETPGNVVSNKRYANGVEIPGVQTSGESVVQRWHYLMTQRKLRKDEAYDQARREFYQVRHRQDIERIVAREEALATGAYFEPGPIEASNKLEDAAYDRFVSWAVDEAERKRQRSMAATALAVDSSKESSGDNVVENGSVDQAGSENGGASSSSPSSAGSPV